jgi:FkbM family methyltransferase
VPMIVVDLGCFPHHDHISIERLVARYRPDVLYGFDPWPGLVEGETYVGDTRVVLERRAAWIEDGEIEFARVRGLRGWDSTVMKTKDSRNEWTKAGRVMRVPCFDLSAWLRTLPEPPVLKLDVEGAEFPILEHLHREGTDALLAELLVEWHDEKMADDLASRRVELTAVLRCPVGAWEGPRKTLFSAIRGRRKSRHAAGAR